MDSNMLLLKKEATDPKLTNKIISQNELTMPWWQNYQKTNNSTQNSTKDTNIWPARTFPILSDLRCSVKEGRSCPKDDTSVVALFRTYQILSITKTRTVLSNTVRLHVYQLLNYYFEDLLYQQKKSYFLSF